MHDTASEMGGASQRRELTFRHNTSLGRHGWLRLTPAYSVKIVETILQHEHPRIAVFDPFCGTATTPLVAASRGIRALSTDINPFLIWFARVKTAHYSQAQLDGARRSLDGFRERIACVEPSRVPPIYNIERWWSADRLYFLRRLKAVIESSCRRGTAAQNLLLVAFCRTMIGLSNAAFNHQSMSFKKVAPHSDRDAEGGSTSALLDVFHADATAVLGGAAENPTADVDIFDDDARTLRSIASRSFDLVVTSPPYPNRMSYVRELRPYLYWLGFIEHARDAGELDWHAIGGTWGIATSRVAQWRPRRRQPLPRRLRDALEQLRLCDAPNAGLLGNYVEKYFCDMRAHLEAVAKRLKRGGRVHYIVGNSTFYDALVPTELVLGHLFEEIGFRNVECRLLRKRNSKKALFEFDVCGVKS